MKTVRFKLTIACKYLRTTKKFRIIEVVLHHPHTSLAFGFRTKYDKYLLFIEKTALNSNSIYSHAPQSGTPTNRVKVKGLIIANCCCGWFVEELNDVMPGSGSCFHHCLALTVVVGRWNRNNKFLIFFQACINYCLMEYLPQQLSDQKTRRASLGRNGNWRVAIAIMTTISGQRNRTPSDPLIGKPINFLRFVHK